MKNLKLKNIIPALILTIIVIILCIFIKNTTQTKQLSDNNSEIAEELEENPNIIISEVTEEDKLNYKKPEVMIEEENYEIDNYNSSNNKYEWNVSKSNFDSSNEYTYFSFIINSKDNEINANSNITIDKNKKIINGILNVSIYNDGNSYNCKYNINTNEEGMLYLSSSAYDSITENIKNELIDILNKETLN